ncbi:hypothetical protein, partial [uncultured Treponema sp.]|uniref:hypothetical protein n=2 Tax=Treponema TaxID=157 RepID=UPI00280B10BA
ARLLDCSIARLLDCSIARLLDCSIGRFENSDYSTGRAVIMKLKFIFIALMSALLSSVVAAEDNF